MDLIGKKKDGCSVDDYMMKVVTAAIKTIDSNSPCFDDTEYCRRGIIEELFRNKEYMKED